MVAMSDLPDELLDLVLQRVTEPLREDRENCDTFHRVAAWYSLATVDSRWQTLMQKYPISLGLVCCDRSYFSDMCDEEVKTSADFRFVTNIKRLRQLAHSRVPVLSLAILQDIQDCHEESAFVPLHALCYEVSQLLTPNDFQRYSGPVLEVLSIQPQDNCCFDFAASPDVYPALRILRGVGGQLRTGLPSGLENLEYTAGGVSVAHGDEPPWTDHRFCRSHLDCAAEAISRLRSLKELHVRRSVFSNVVPLPFSFVSQLPPSVQVAHFLLLRLEFVCGVKGSHPAEQRQAAAPTHLKLAGWSEFPKDFDDGTVQADFTLLTNDTAAGERQA